MASVYNPEIPASIAAETVIQLPLVCVQSPQDRAKLSHLRNYWALHGKAAR